METRFSVIVAPVRGKQLPELIEFLNGLNVPIHEIKALEHDVTGRPKLNRKRVTSGDREKMKALYQAGDNVPAIAEKMGFSEITVKRHLQKL